MADRIDQQWQPREVARLLALVEGERRYFQEMMAELPVPLAIVGSDRYLVYANRAFRSAFQLHGDDVRRKAISQILPGAPLEEALTAIDKQREISPVVLSDGKRVLRVSLFSLARWEENGARETVVIAEDVTELVPTAQPVAEAQEQIPIFGAVLWEADRDTLRFQRIFGDTEAFSGQPAQVWLNQERFFEERVHPEDRASTMALYARAIAAGNEVSAEFRALSPAGHVIWCRETIHTDGRIVRGVISDFTARKAAETQLLTAARQDALREVSGKLAHSLNNPLMIISGYQEELMTASGTTAPADWAEMAAATRRISEIAARLSAYVRPAAQPAGRLTSA